MVLGYYAKVDFVAFETFSAREQNWNHYFPNLIYPLITSPHPPPPAPPPHLPLFLMGSNFWFG